MIVMQDICIKGVHDDSKQFFFQQRGLQNRFNCRSCNVYENWKIAEKFELPLYFLSSWQLLAWKLF